MKFDIIVGNPPYNPKKQNVRGFGGRNIIWNKFIIKSMKYLSNYGYMVIVHPSLWRKPEHKLWKILTDRQIQYLEIHNSKDGIKTFGVKTRYDWYVLCNRKQYKKTIVIDEKSKKFNINLRKLNFLPNYNLKNILKILAVDDEESLDVLFSYECDSRAIYMSTKKNNNFIYPSINQIRSKKNGGMILYYCSEYDRGFRNKKKVIITNGIVRPYNDYKCEYGTTAESFGIKIQNKKDGDLMVKAINTKKFKEIINATKWSNFRTEYRMFKYFKKDFWKYFVDENDNEIK